LVVPICWFDALTICNHKNGGKVLEVIAKSGTFANSMVIRTLKWTL